MKHHAAKANSRVEVQLHAFWNFLPVGGESSVSRPIGESAAAAAPAPPRTHPVGRMGTAAVWVPCLWPESNLDFSVVHNAAENKASIANQEPNPSDSE